jgi:hypothetical protein
MPKRRSSNHPHRSEAFPPQQHGGGNEQVACEEIREQVALRVRVKSHTQRVALNGVPIGVDRAEGGVYQPDTRIALHHRDLLLQLLRQPQVVRVEDSDVWRLREPDALVQRGIGAAVRRVLDYLHAVGIALQDGKRFVAAGVVDNDHLDVPEGLRQRALYRLR